MTAGADSWTYMRAARGKHVKRQMEEDEYVSLARRSLEYYVHEGRMIPFGRGRGRPAGGNASEQGAGVFVSVRQGRRFAGLHRDDRAGLQEYCGGNHTERSECRHP